MSILTTIPEIKTLTDLVKHSNQLPTIRNSDKHEVEKSIVTLILEVFNFYNESPNDIQLKLMLPTLIEAMNRLTLPDIEIFKKNCLLGKYDLKFRLTPPVLIEWIKEYEFQRMEAFENANLKAKIEVERQPVSDKTLELLKELADKMKQTPIYSTDKPTESAVERQAKDLQEFIKKEFNLLWRKQGNQTIFVGGRDEMFVTYQSKKMFMFYFVELRYKEIHEQTKSNFEAIEKIINEA